MQPVGAGAGGGPRYADVARAVERALLLAFCARTSGAEELAALAKRLGQGRDPKDVAWAQVVESAQDILRGAYEKSLQTNCPWVYELTFEASREIVCEPEEHDEQAFATRVNGMIGTLLSDTDEEQKLLKALQVLCGGVASLLRFLQANLTGPELPIASYLTREVYRAADSAAPDDSTSGIPQSKSCLAKLEEERKLKRRSLELEWKTEVLRGLAIDGNIVAANFTEPTLLLIALLLLNGLDRTLRQQQRVHLESLAWWSARAEAMQQKTLEGRCPSLKKSRVEKLQRIRMYFRMPLDSNKTRTRESRDSAALACAACIETALAYADYGDSNAMAPYLKEAAGWIGVTVSLGGAMGKRTIHQVDEKAQLVVAIESIDGKPMKAEDEGGDDLVEIDEETEGYVGDELENANNDIIAGARTSDILRTPALSSNQDLRVASAGHLSASMQFLLLAECLYTKREQARDELSAWRMAPYIEAVSSQSKSLFLAQQLCHLLLARKEKSRGRTCERSLVGMYKLVERQGMIKLNEHVSITGEKILETPYGKTPQEIASDEEEQMRLASRRLRGCFTLQFPFAPFLRKELGESLVGMGLLGEAMPLFESCELWDNLILCYRLLQKAPAASALIHERLKFTPEDPRLWCALGDLENNSKHYEHAWKVSGGRHTRAKRSLARDALHKEEWAEAKMHWKQALDINPLHPDGWFSLGFCSLKTGDEDLAIYAFTRAVQLDSDHAEAWNNLAAMHMKRKKYKAAYFSLREALKFKRHSWNMWDNFATVALKNGHWAEGARAILKVMELSETRIVDPATLLVLIHQLERYHASEAAKASQNTTHFVKSEDVNPLVEAEKGDPLTGIDLLTEEMGQSDLCANEEDDSESGWPQSDVREALAAVSEENAFEKLDDTSQEAVDVAEQRRIEEEMQMTRKTAKSVEEMLRQIFKELVASTGANTGGAGNLNAVAMNNEQTSAEVWPIYARFCTMRGEHQSATECLLKYCRSLQSTPWDRDEEAFEAFGKASLELCVAYRKAAHERANRIQTEAGQNKAKSHAEIRTGTAEQTLANLKSGKQYLSSARMHLRSILARSKDTFEGYAVYSQMESQLEIIVEEEAALVARIKDLSDG